MFNFLIGMVFLICLILLAEELFEDAMKETGKDGCGCLVIIFLLIAIGVLSIAVSAPAGMLILALLFIWWRSK